MRESELPAVPKNKFPEEPQGQRQITISEMEKYKRQLE